MTHPEINHFDFPRLIIEINYRDTQILRNTYNCNTLSSTISGSIEPKIDLNLGWNKSSFQCEEGRLQERKDSQQVWNGKNTRIPRALISMRRGFFKPRIFSSSMNLRVENLIMTSQQAWSSKRIIRPRFPRYLLKINSFIFPRRREKRRKILWKNFAERERNYCCLFIAAG